MNLKKSMLMLKVTHLNQLLAKTGLPIKLIDVTGRIASRL